MEAYSSSSKRHFVYCTYKISFSFNFDWLYPMTHVSSGDNKGVIFFLTFASSFMWCGQCFQEELYIVTIFTLKSNLTHKSRNPLEPLQYCQYSFAPYLKCDLHSSRYQYTKFCTCMKNRTVFAICHSTIRTY